MGVRRNRRFRHLPPGRTPHRVRNTTTERSGNSTSSPTTSTAETASAATSFALVLLRELAHAGVTEIVVSPGSRSQALALAAVALERAGGVHVHVRLDERTAGFFALGLGVETGRPAAVMTTSGTAVANLHPAVLEAHHSGVPMIVLSADRPAELRGIASNQTTIQPGIFGSAARLVRDVDAPTREDDEETRTALARSLAMEAVAAAAGHAGAPGPVQLNLAFREPLSGPIGEVDPIPEHSIDVEFARRRTRRSITDDVTLTPDAEPATVVIAGHDAGPDAERIAWELGAPLLAEVSSGAHFGRNLVVAYRELLRDADFGGRVRRAVVLGHPTLSREVPRLLQRADVDAIVLRGAIPEAYDPGKSLGPGRAATVVDGILVEGKPARAHRAWVGRWVTASRRLLGDGDAAPDLEAKRSPDRAERNRFLKEEVAISRRPVDRALLVEAVWAATWPHDRLILGASQLIREMDLRAQGKKITVHSNRGLAGIDGTISTSLGIAAALAGSPALPGTTRVLVGDLTFLHDVGALVTGTEERTHRVQVIVGNDSGGEIFNRLEVADTARPDDMRRVMTTPQRVDVERIATGFGWEYRRAQTWGELQRLLTDPTERVVIEVPIAD